MGLLNPEQLIKPLLAGQVAREQGLINGRFGRNAVTPPPMQYPNAGFVESMGQAANDIAQTVQQPLAYMTPGIGDYLAHQDAVEKYQKAKQAWGQGNYGQAAMYGLGGLGDDLTTVPAIGDLAMLGKGLGAMAMPLMTAYHGTPHRFPPTEKNPLGEFDLSKIGTGEGAQAYGHGIYLAENPGVAHSYKVMNERPAVVEAGDYATRLQYKTDIFENVMAKHPDFDRSEVARMADNYSRQFWNRAEKFGGSGDEVMMKVWLEDKASFSEGLKKPPYNNSGVDSAVIDEMATMPLPKLIKNEGSLYEVDLPDDQIAKMLDWDAPLSMDEAKRIESVLRDSLNIQPVKQADGRYGLTLVGKDGSGKVMEEIGFAGKSAVETDTAISRAIVGLNGSDVYRMITRMAGSPDTASNLLNTAGIPGIKYYDGGSRAKGEGTRNFVLFDPEIAKIIDRK